MSDIAIHQLPQAGALTGAEVVPIDDGTATVRTTITAIRQGLAVAEHGHAMADLDGLQAALDARAPLASPAFTGAVAVSAGSAASPALGHAGDTDTGLFFPAANTLAFASGGIERLRIAGGLFRCPTGLGNTLIGLAPDTSHQATNAAAVALVAADGGGYSGVFVHNTHDGTFSSQDIRLLTAKGGVSGSTERMRVASDGTVTLGGAPGAESLRVAPVPGATSAVTVTGSNGGDPVLTTTSGRLSFGAVPVLPSYTVATLPSASARGLVYVSNGAANKRLAVSDGSNWRWPDGTLVS